jgi:GGDEF domain-containing protein
MLRATACCTRARSAWSRRPASATTVARLGGDEFAVLLENLTGREPVMEIAARIVESLQEPLDLPGADACIAASVGVAFSSPTTASRN